MSRISIPENVQAAPCASQPLLAAVGEQLGTIPNLHRLVSKSPAALRGYLDLLSALSKGALPAQTRQRLAIAIAAVNGCDYCLSAHSYLGKHVAKLSDTELASNQRGASSDARADAALKFAIKAIESRGELAESDIRTLKAAGYDDAELIEIVLHVALNVFTNYLNKIVETNIDFPLISARTAA